MSTSSPKLTAIIPTYNRASSIMSAVRSVRTSSAVAQIVVVDDGSTDATVEVLEAAGGVDVVRLDGNQGPSAARNAGLKAARNDLVAFLDSDDAWLPGALDEHLNWMHERDLEMSAAGTLRYPANRTVPVVQIRPFPERLTMRQLAWGCFVSPGSTMIARRATLEAIGGYDPALRRLEDWDLLIRLAASAVPMGYFPAPTAIIRRTGFPQGDLVRQAIDHLRSKHHDRFQAAGPVWSRTFESAVEFQVALSWVLDGEPTKALRSMARSVRQVPVGHLAVRLFLRDRLAAGWPSVRLGGGPGAPS